MLNIVSYCDRDDTGTAAQPSAEQQSANYRTKAFESIDISSDNETVNHDEGCHHEVVAGMMKHGVVYRPHYPPHGHLHEHLHMHARLHRHPHLPRHGHPRPHHPPHGHGHPHHHPHPHHHHHPFRHSFGSHVSQQGHHADGHCHDSVVKAFQAFGVGHAGGHLERAHSYPMA
ncbi:uncharacterized protein [Eurosta solidaginis]|uniref:uncharacterized protein n=1 Tax=Eurosta solidaginis TaxID=178769 RepID=UPI0035310B5F